MVVGLEHSQKIEVEMGRKKKQCKRPGNPILKEKLRSAMISWKTQQEVIYDKQP
jgi:hypothetical protein